MYQAEAIISPLLKMAHCAVASCRIDIKTAQVTYTVRQGRRMAEMNPLNLNQIMLAEGGRVVIIHVARALPPSKGSDAMTPNKALQEMRARAPLVHCITNYVAMNIAANVVLAAGASPAMLHASEEVADFVPAVGALTINIGTLSASWVDAMKKAAITANDANVPWVLDPVAHFATPYRATVARDLMALHPTIIRGNASEIRALAGQGAAGKGADSGDSVADARDAAIRLAQSQTCIVAVTGETDFVTDGNRKADIAGGADIMPKVTALGCSLTALVGAYAAICPPMEATVAALTHFAEAGASAAPTSHGPGSFAVQFLDQLAQLGPGDLEESRVTWR